MMKMSEIRDMKMDELHAELDRVRHHLFDLRAQSTTEKLENPYLLRAARKEIARILTVMRERGETSIEEKQMHLESASRQQQVAQ